MTAPVIGMLCAETQLNIAGPRWEIDDEIVELAPRHLVEELAQGLGQHRTTPDHRLTGIEDCAERHNLEPMSLERRHLAVGSGMRALTNAEHDRHIRSIDIGIKQPDPCSGEPQRDRDVDRDGGLADTALACADRNRIPDSGDLLAPRQPSRGADVGVPADLDPRDTRHHPDDRGVDVLADAILERTCRRGEHNSNRGHATLDRQVSQHPELEHRLVQFGIDDGGKGVLEGVERPGITHLALSIPTLPHAEAQEG